MRKKQGKEKANEMGFYILTVKAQFLFLISLYYTNLEDYRRVAIEYEEFNREAEEIMKTIYDNEYRYGKKHGKGQEIDAHGSYIGEFVKGTREGKGKMTYESGDVYIGEFRGGEMTGHGEYKWNNGSVYIGEWRGSKWTGYGEYKHNNGNSYSGLWVDGVRHGSGEYKWGPGKWAGESYNGLWADGVQHGSGVYTYASGETEKREYVKGEYVRGEKQ